MNITLKQLRVFLAIVQHGNMANAAAHLFMTKGAISQTLAELESRIGTNLFNRQHAQLYLTQAGRKLVPLADEMLLRIQDMAQSLSASALDHQLLLGCTKTIGSYLIAELLTRFEREYGWVPSLTIANTRVIGQMLSRFEIDLALIEGPCTEPHLVCEPWLDDEMVVIAAKSHPLARKKKISFQELSQERWILRELGSSSRAYFDHHFAPHLNQAQIVLSLDAFDTILTCVHNQLGITLISSLILRQPFYAKYFSLLTTEKRFYRKLQICYHQEKFISATLQTWLMHVKSMTDW